MKPKIPCTDSLPEEEFRAELEKEKLRETENPSETDFDVARFESFGGFESVETTRTNPRPAPPPIVEGLLNKTEFALVASDAKGRKTMFLMQLAICTAIGKPFLGFRTRKSRVLYLNLELLPFAWDSRIGRMTESLEVHRGELKGLLAWQLRGKGMKVSDLAPALRYRMESDRLPGFDLLVIDPLYPLFRGDDENAAGEMAEALSQVVDLTTKFDVAVVACHHYAKGRQEDKRDLDRASGSGVFARIADDFATLTVKDQKREESAPLTRFAEVRRNFRSPLPLKIRFNPDTCLWEVEPEEETEIAVGNKESVLALFETEERTFRRAEMQKLFEKRGWGKKTKADECISRAIAEGVLYNAGGSKNRPLYGLTESGRTRWRDFRGLPALPLQPAAL